MTTRPAVERLPAPGAVAPAFPTTFGSDRLAMLLAELGYRFIAFNPGASFRGLHDSLANLEGAPRIIMTTHEEIAVAIAHGYAKAAGEPMAAAVHNVVGLQHATMAIFNAWCDQAPILVIGATGPVDAARRRPFIDWVHTALVQGQLVRDYVKWDDQPASLEAAVEALVRADRIARAEPPGPVYVCLDVTTQEEVAVADAPWTRPAPPTSLYPEPEAIEIAAEWLIAAKRPLALADMAGRDPLVPAALVSLAEHLGMPVVDLGGRFNFPSRHPLDATDSVSNAAPDVVLALELADAAGQLRRLVETSGGGAPRVISVGTRELALRSWAAHYQAIAPSDLSITAAAGPTIAAIDAACRRRSPEPATHRLRHDETGARQRRAAWEEAAHAVAGEQPIAHAWLILCLREALAGRRWSFVNAPIENPWPRRLLDLDEPWQFLGGSGGAGIGYAAGASIGAALALRERGALAVGVLGDGDLLYTPGAIWTAVHERIPVLLIVANNRSYHNSENHALTMARLRRRPVEHASIGTRIVDPDVDFAALARSLGAQGHGPVFDPGALDGILRQAVADVEDGRVAVVDVVCQAR
jgi:thiamine pyrophosphate-dependent acetolactate synthase large subunit-like protein